jgi:hypothetical protein
MFFVSIGFILLFYLVERASSFWVFFYFALKIGFLCGFLFLVLLVFLFTPKYIFRIK